MSSHVIDIAQTRTDTIRIYGSDIAEGDKVFDAFGNTYAIVRTHTRKNGGQKTTRQDSWVDFYQPNDEVTVVPGAAGRGREIDKVSSGSRNGYIETGRYSTVAEEREINPTSHTNDQEV